ncbi:MAG: hypothetical protein IJ225_02795 [Solobacterium sp.]|nr:hypothetical protein [Solobacterium sp.]
MTVLLEVIKMILTGILEGVTQWLPISSRAHLILLDTLLPMNRSTSFSEILLLVIETGAWLGLVTVMFRRLWPWSKRRSSRKQILERWKHIGPAALLWSIELLFLEPLLPSFLHTPAVLCVMSGGIGVLMILFSHHAVQNNRTALTLGGSVLVGAVGCIYLLPGASFVGTVLVLCVILGMNRSSSMEFSLEASVPVIAVSIVHRLMGMEGSVMLVEAVLLLIALITAYLVSVWMIKGILRSFYQADLKLLGYYRIVLAMVMMILSLIGALPESMGVYL